MNLKFHIEDTVNDFSSFDVASLDKVETNELSKSTRVVVVDSLGITKGLQDGARGRRREREREREMRMRYLRLTFVEAIANQLPVLH